MIPELVDNVLPEGVHDCTFEEIDERFGQFQRTDRRVKLTAKLRQFLDDARKSGIVVAVVVDGSYVTARDEPSDIDLLVAYRAGLDLKYEGLRPFEYNVLSKTAARRHYRFDVFIEAEGSDGYFQWIEFFRGVRPNDPRLATAQVRKGVLRVVL